MSRHANQMDLNPRRVADSDNEATDDLEDADS